MKVLVTGGTGFIGGHLASALIEKGHQVKVIARNPQKAKSVEKIGAKVVIGDLGNKKFLKKELAGFKIVYHLAAIPGQSWRIPWEEYKRVNVDFTKNLLKAAAQNKVKKFIFCSSIQVADPLTSYGKSKLEAEEAVERSGLEYIIIRSGVVYGPGDKKSVLRVCGLVQKGFFPLINSGKSRLAIIFIDDLIDLFLQSLARRVKNRKLWGIGEEISWEGLIVAISKELKKPCWRIHLLARLAKVIAGFSEAISLITKIQPPITREQIDFITSDWHFDISKEERKFWQPKVKFRQGIKKTSQWYKSNGYL